MCQEECQLLYNINKYIATQWGLCCLVYNIGKQSPERLSNLLEAISTQALTDETGIWIQEADYAFAHKHQVSWAADTKIRHQISDIKQEL